MKRNAFYGIFFLLWTLVTIRVITNVCYLGCILIYFANLKACNCCDEDAPGYASFPMGFVEVQSTAKMCLHFCTWELGGGVQNNPVKHLPPFQKPQGSDRLSWAQCRTPAATCSPLPSLSCPSSVWCLPALPRLQLCVPVPGTCLAVDGPQAVLEEPTFHAFLWTSQHSN